MNAWLAWAEKLPEKWEAVPLRAAADFTVSNVDKIPADDEQPVRLCNYTDVYNNEFITADMDFMRGTATPAEIAKFGLQIGDVPITKDSEEWDDIGIPALVIKTADDLVCGYHLALLRPRAEKLDGRFLFRCLQAKDIRIHLELAANGVTRFGIPKDEIGKLPVPVPPVPEQMAIADFLDRETARLDALVSAKERWLELLAEKRRALITRAVTRGLNPVAPLRDSGLPRLGHIPSHWQTKKLKHVAALQSGDVITAEDISQSGDYPVFGGNGIRGYSSAFNHEGNFVLIGRQGALCGNINYATGRFWASEHAVVATIRGGDHFNWLGELLNVMNLNQYSQSAAQPGLAVDVIANLSIPIPPLEEQRAIVAHISGEAAKLDALRSATERTIGLLRERRAALIAAAVTGKLKIPHAV